MSISGEITNCVFIGAGNLATQSALALQKAGVEVRQIYSRTEESAKALADKCGCAFTADTDKILSDAHLYLYAVKDDILPDIIQKIKIRKGIHAHTAGSIPVSVFAGLRENYGVFYPLQTFSKTKAVNFGNIPIFIEANAPENLQMLKVLAEKLSNRVEVCTSTERQALHLAAVFCCNFSNHLFDIASRILAKNNLPFDSMLPLINETIGKLQTLTPAEAQTGPALRYDTGVINRHLAALADMPDEQRIYELMTGNIYRLSGQQ